MSASILLAFAHTAGNIAVRHYPQSSEDISDALVFFDNVGLILGISGGAGAIVGRASAVAPVYTPDWLPGPDKKDVVATERPELNTSYGFAATAKTNSSDVVEIKKE